ncbi:hypothetical protein G9A89_010374 [Geosiphon pyriformis]|nr:hypothetical protein G9A89_010374 [Geosiphon pyriformis]
MKKVVKEFRFGGGFKPVLSRKKRKCVVLEESISSKEDSKTGNTTKSESIDIEKKCLVEETSFDYGKRGTIIGRDHNYISKEPNVKTTKALGKPLDKINFSSYDDNDDVLLDTSLELPSPLKNLVTVSVRKSFTLDIDLDKIVGKSSQEKLMVIRKLFLKINGFGGTSTASKFAEIIRALFTSESSLAQASKKAEDVKILVNSNLKKSTGHLDQTVVVKEILVETSAEAVCAVLSEFGIIKLIKIQLVELWQKAVVEFEQLDHADLVAAKTDLDKETWDAKNYHRALLYTLPMGTNAHGIWNFVRSVSEKTCIIDHYPITYAWIRCTVVCFNSAELLDTAMETTPFSFVSAKCTKCKKSDYISLSCAKDEKVSSGSLLHKVLSDADKSRLAVIYTKCSAPVTHPVFFGGLSWTKIISGSSFPPLFGQVVSSNIGSFLEMKSFLPVANEINNRFATLEHNLVSLVERVDMLAKRLETSEPIIDIVMGEGSGVATGGKTVVKTVVFDFFVIRKIENTLKNLAITVMGLSAKMDNAGSCCFLFSMTELQEDVVCWHIKSENMVFIVMETKLRPNTRLWIMNRFDGMRIFSSSLDKDFLGAGVAIILNNSLAYYVVKIEEIPSHLISIWLLFKGKLSITILGLYAGASAETRFGQSSVINFFITKTVNSSIFVVLNRDFNENRSRKNASFKFCSELGLVNAFSGHSLINASTWGNLRGAMKVIDYIFVNRSLLSAVAGDKIISVLNFFDTNHNAVMKFNIKDADNAKWLCYKDCSSARLLGVKNRFFATAVNNNLNSMWSVLEELTLDANKALVVTCMVQAGEKQMDILKHLSLVKRKYKKSKIYKLKLAKKASIRNTIEKCMEKFCLDKDGMIKSVLNCSFHKVVLDYLVIDDELVLEPKKVMSDVDKIMEGWMRKCLMLPVLPDLWTCQYVPLGYVKDDVFSGVIFAINMSKLVLVIGSLPDGKTAGLLDIPNELWKHGSKKPYNWNGVLMNTQPIALIETARKILSKILFDHISLSLVFAVELIIEDALKKNKEIWLHHLKTSLWHVKMCSRFIEFFGNIHENKINRVITDFGLSDGYKIHDGIFYDPLLCKVKQYKQLCEYRINTKFVSRTGRIESGSEMTSYFAADTFYALNIVSKFFVVNNISINSEKMVAILINQDIRIASLSICGQPILIAKKGETYCYLEIFLFTKGLSKPSVNRAHSGIHFFTNVLLKKAVMNKQFLYLVLAVLQFIVGYQTQFNIMIRKGLKSKVCLPCNFPSEALYYPSLYGLKSFEQVQAESKLAAFLNLQVSGWAPLNPLRFPVRLYVSPVNNFLTGVVRIFLDNKLSLANKLLNAFYNPGVFLMSLVLGKSLFFDFKRLDPRGPVSYWFVLTSKFLNDKSFFGSVLDGLHEIWSGNFEVYTDSSLKNTGSNEGMYGTAVYFLVLDMDIGIGIWDLLFSTMAELQMVALALECVPFSCGVDVYFNSQAAIDACVSEIVLVKGHSGVTSNMKANTLVSKAADSPVFLPMGVQEQFLMTKNLAISGNTCHFSVGWQCGLGHHLKGVTP